MTIERLAIPQRDADEESTLQAARFAQIPVIVVYDPPPVPRGYPARFRVRVMDGFQAFSVHAATADGTGTDGDDYEALVGDFEFIGEGFIDVTTLSDGDPGAEFFLNITAISPALIVRDHARAQLSAFSCVYDLGVYDVGVYECS